MATRPLFVPRRSRTSLVVEIPIEFHWFAGMAVSQKQNSIRSLHEAAGARLKTSRLLEISSKSPDPIGVRLSAFNLMLPLGDRSVSVEVAFQAGKLFEKGGPFLDLLAGSAREAKRDPRLKGSGLLIGFVLEDESWALEPRTAFYDWLYLRALSANPEIADHLLQFDAFTDIEFNPEKSLNCQARSAALFVSMSREGLLETALSGKKGYFEILNSH